MSEHITHLGLRWERDRTTPAIVWRTEYGHYEIVWDPAGQREGEPGGWYLWAAQELLGIFLSVRAAQQAAAEHATKSPMIQAER